MKIAALTITSGSTGNLSLISRYVFRQTRQPDLWVVSNDHNDKPEDIGQGPYNPKNASKVKKAVAENMLVGLASIPGDYAVVAMEDDDWYAPQHLEEMEKALQTGAPIVGAKSIAQYNVLERHWIEEPAIVKHGVAHTALAWSAFHPSGRSRIEKVFRRCAENGMAACYRIWEEFKVPPEMPRTGVGIKGMPGTGVSGKHNLAYSRSKGHVWTADPDLVKLRKWVGEDVEHYRSFGES